MCSGELVFKFKSFDQAISFLCNYLRVDLDHLQYLYIKAGDSVYAALDIEIAIKFLDEKLGINIHDDFENFNPEHVARESGFEPVDLSMFDYM
jgi:hypothetical protein